MVNTQIANELYKMIGSFKVSSPAQSIALTEIEEKIKQVLEQSYEGYQAIHDALKETNVIQPGNDITTEDVVTIAIKTIISKLSTVTKLNDKKVYAKLMAIALDAWQNDGTSFDFHKWLLERGLSFKDGFFITT